MDDRMIVAAARGGDREAFNQLVLLYQDMAYHLAYRMLGDAEAAADATQDAFLAAYRAINQFRDGSFRAWMWRIVTNTCYTELRHRRRAAESLDELEEDGRTPVSLPAGEQPEQRAERRELDGLIQAGLLALPVEQRVVVVLSDVQGLDYREIGQVTGLSPGTVKSRLSRGRARLRDYLSASTVMPATAAQGRPGQGRNAASRRRGGAGRSDGRPEREGRAAVPAPPGRPRLAVASQV